MKFEVPRIARAMFSIVAFPRHARRSSRKKSAAGRLLASADRAVVNNRMRLARSSDLNRRDAIAVNP
jgi:hypothetical protein